MKPTRSLSRAGLLRAIDAANKAQSAAIEAMIAAGRGNETYQTTIRKSDPLSQRYREAFDRYAELSAEHARRMTYHGKLTPIKARP